MKQPNAADAIHYLAAANRELEAEVDDLRRLRRADALRLSQRDTMLRAAILAILSRRELRRLRRGRPAWSTVRDLLNVGSHTAGDLLESLGLDAESGKPRRPSL